jgi:NIMA (never in mitosis gene a)-related kinase
VSNSKNNDMSSLKDWQLPVRERRQLKQAQEKLLPSVSFSEENSECSWSRETQEEGQPTPAWWFSSDYNIAQERKLIYCLSEDELSSSTSSIDQSDRYSREGKRHTNEMSDLVQLKSHTFKLNSKDSCDDLPVPNPVSELKLHQKSRDTLVLHGKVAEEKEELQFKEQLQLSCQVLKRSVESMRSWELMSSGKWHSAFRTSVWSFGRRGWISERGTVTGTREWKV